ncbi:MAG TPA: transcriptional regulator [Desulfosporosinus sp.]|nr:transcriptional regulator [Desulfosporosinus sp.]
MAPSKELTNRLEDTLRRANNVLLKQGRSILVNLEISALQFNTLLSIREVGSMTMGDVCKNLFVACSTATDLADRMERIELVERVRDDKDRRVIRLRLLPRGNEVIDAVIAERQRFIGEVLKEYTEQEYLELSRGLELLAERMELI